MMNDEVTDVPTVCCISDCSGHSLVPPHLTGSYLIRPVSSNRSTPVYCEMLEDAAGEEVWTVIQRRSDGSVSFNRTWNDYKHGFGSVEGEHYLGNDIIYQLTNQGNYTLHIDMWDLHGEYWVAEYPYFHLDGEKDNYRLHLNGYHGNASDAFRYSNNMPFSTVDRDNDMSSTHCAKYYTAGWWYKHCHYSNMNGRYTVGLVWFHQDWDEWVQMKKVVMKIKPNQAQALDSEQAALEESKTTKATPQSKSAEENSSEVKGQSNRTGEKDSTATKLP